MREDVDFVKGAALLRVGKRATRARSLYTLPLLLGPLAFGCGQGKSNPSGLASAGSEPTGREIPPVTACNTPQEGCPCDNDADVVDCGSVVRHSGDYTACSMGQRTCTDGKWGACEGDKIDRKST